MTEAPLQSGEWGRIKTLVEALSADPALSWIPPSSVLKPIPVKKQDKYNVLRWALTGRKAPTDQPSVLFQR